MSTRWLLGLAGGVGGAAAFWYASNNTGAGASKVDRGTPEERLATCLRERGLTLHGTNWCGWCTKQLQMFGAAHDGVPYKDCTGPGGKGWSDECRKKGLKVVPSWTTADGRIIIGTQGLAQLAEMCNCANVSPDEFK